MGTAVSKLTGLEQTTSWHEYGNQFSDHVMTTCEYVCINIMHITKYSDDGIRPHEEALQHQVSKLFKHVYAGIQFKRLPLYIHDKLYIVYSQSQKLHQRGTYAQHITRPAHPDWKVRNVTKQELHAGNQWPSKYASHLGKGKIQVLYEEKNIKQDTAFKGIWEKLVLHRKSEHDWARVLSTKMTERNKTRMHSTKR